MNYKLIRDAALRKRFSRESWAYRDNNLRGEERILNLAEWWRTTDAGDSAGTAAAAAAAGSVTWNWWMAAGAGIRTTTELQASCSSGIGPSHVTRSVPDDAPPPVTVVAIRHYLPFPASTKTRPAGHRRRPPDLQGRSWPLGSATGLYASPPATIWQIFIPSISCSVCRIYIYNLSCVLAYMWESTINIAQ